MFFYKWVFFYRGYFFPGLFYWQFFYTWTFVFFFLFNPGHGFFTNELFYTRHALSQNIFFTNLFFLQMSFFYRAYFFPGLFYWQVFLHLNFLHNIRPTSPALDLLTSGLSSLGMSVPDMSTKYMTSTNKFFTQNIPSPRWTLHPVLSVTVWLLQ